MKVTAIPALSDNYIWHIQKNELNIIVDPALFEPVDEYLMKNNLQLDYIINTHHHSDHVGGNEELKSKYHCQVIAPEYDKHRIPAIDKTVRHQDEIHFAPQIFKSQDSSLSAKILYTPGHTLGHIVYWFENQKSLFCGDTLFSLGCGRLFEGSPQQMWQSLNEIKKLPDETLVYCTHEYTFNNARFALSLEPNNQKLIEKINWIKKVRQEGLPTLPTTLGEEKELNPFLRPHNKDIRQSVNLSGPKLSDVDIFAKVRTLKDHFQ